MISGFQILLLVLVATATFYFMIVTRRSAVQRLFVVAFLVTVAACVLFPNATTVVANKLGVGRGVDLALYLSVFFLLVALFQLQLRVKANEARMTVIVRELALRHPLQSASVAAGERGATETSA